MKAKHRKVLKEKLTVLLPKIEAFLKNEGLEDFDLQSIGFKHMDEIRRACDPATEEPCKIWNGTRYVRTCVPKGMCPK